MPVSGRHKGESNGPDDDQKSKSFQQDGVIEWCRLESGSETESSKQSPVAPKAFEPQAETDLSKQELERSRRRRQGRAERSEQQGVGRFGENVGKVTAEFRRLREGLAGRDAKQNSPLEILLKGLTTRR